ncbi:MAG TPA: CSLREA domain-containing protein, partial [Anaerolineales bacterium]|nr:CSLREA domain-containing protein [Anaerolineales bacterium]
MKSRSFNLLVILALFLSLLGSAVTVTPAHAASFVVNTNADTNDGTCDAANCTLREAINAANANGFGLDTITFAADYTITLTSQLPTVNTPITINGNGATKTIIQANAL